MSSRITPLEKFGVRGSSTADYTKKPYKLKFINSPANVFGMTKDKSWTLLANYLDQSAMRDKVGLQLGRRMGNIPGRRTAASSRCSSTTSTRVPTRWSSRSRSTATASTSTRRRA